MSGQPSSSSAIICVRSWLRIHTCESYWLWQPLNVIVVSCVSVSAYSTSLAPEPTVLVPPTVVSLMVWPQMMVGIGGLGAAVAGAEVVGVDVVGVDEVGSPADEGGELGEAVVGADVVGGADEVGSPVAHCMSTANSPLLLR